MQEMQVWSLGQENPLQEEMVTHSNILAWKILWTEKLGGLQSIGLQRVYCEERPHDDWISALSGRGRETSFFSLPHEDTFEPGREFSAESEHAVPWSLALEFWDVMLGCLSHSIHNILLPQPRLMRTWLPRLGQCHSTSSWLCTPFLECIHWILKLKCMTSGYPEAAMLERPVDRIHENRSVPEEHQLF